MIIAKLHDGEVDIGPSIARHLVDSQFPEWRNLPLRLVESSGTVHVLFRLGSDKVLRLPRLEWQDSTHEAAWLPRLAEHVPIDIPEPIAIGRPDGRYPLHWAVHRWIDGEVLSTHDVESESQLAEDLAHLVQAFWSFQAPDGPPATCGSVQERDAATRRSIEQLDDELDVGTILSEWQDATRSDPFTGTPVWVHADLFPSNLLIRRGRLAAVIDFGDSGLGDPACDLLPAWSVLTSTTRSRFRTILGVDEPTWHRGRAMAFSKALRAVPYYRSSLPSFAAVARRTLAEVRADLATGG